MTFSIFDDTPIADPFGFGERAVKFLRMLKHPKSTLPNKQFQLDPWQERIVRAIYGPRHEDGRRIVRTVAIMLPRGNRKTSLGAALSLLHVFGPESMPGGECMVAASDRSQARIAYEESFNIIQCDKYIEGKLRLVDSKNHIRNQKTGAFLDAISADAKTAHGHTPVFALADELHVWPKRDLWEAIKSGLVKVPGSLLVVISTAGRGQENVAWDFYDYARKVARGEVVDETWLPILLETPRDADWRDENVWRAVNPGIPHGYPDIEGLRQLAREAESIPAEREAFRQFNLNVWLDHTTDPFVDMMVYDKGKAEVDLLDLEGKPCWLAADLSSVHDLTAVVACWSDDNGGYIVKPWFFCPADNLRKKADKDGVPYPQWAEEGHIIPTPGNVVDFRAVEDHIRELCAQFEVREIAFDPHLARNLIANLLEDGFPAVEMRQGWVTMAPAIRDLERAIIGGGFRHGGHPVLRWNFDNIAVETDKAGNKSFHKGKSKDRIDGAVAAAMAVARCAAGDTGISSYDTFEGELDEWSLRIMADDTERLFVALEARVTQFEREWKRAGQTGTRTFQDLRQNSSRATKQMEQDAARSASRVNQAFATISTKVGDYGKAFGLGLAGGIATAGLGALAVAVKGVTSSFAELGQEAKTAGLNVEDFQRWRYVAEQNRIGIDAMIDGFKELNLRADEYIATGKGSAAESFQRLGMSPEDVKSRIKDPSAFMLELIERTRQLKNTAAGVRIFDELLGGSGGEQFVRLIEQGREQLQATMDEADSMGAIFDKEWIDRAEEIDKKFNRISNTVGTALKGAIVDAAQALAEFIDGFNKFENQQRRTLQNRQTAIMGEKNALAAEISAAENDRDAISKSGGGSAGVLSGQIGELKQRMNELNAEEDKIIAILSQRTEDEAKANKDLAPTFEPYVPPEKPKKTGTKGSANKGNKERADEYQRLTERIRENILALQAEAEAQGMLNPAINDYGYAVEKARMQQELMNAAKRAGKEITPELKKEIEGLAHQYASTRAEAEKMAEAQNKALDDLEYRKDIVRDALGGLRNALADGKISFEELGDIALSVLDKIIDKIETQLIDAIFNMNSAMGGGGGGIFGGLLGGIFGGGNSDPWAGMRVPGFANGTSFAPGGLSWVGERGPELMDLPRGAQIVPNHRVGGYLAGGGSPGAADPASVSKSTVEVKLADGLVGEILQQSNKNANEIVLRYDKQKRSAYQNGDSSW